MPSPRVPFVEFVLKVNSRCNLSCDYCYMYESADRSWRGIDAAMSAETLAKAAERIAEHVERHRLPRIRVIFHGGEPMLSGAPTLVEAARVLRRAVGPGTRVDCHVQTNGLLLNGRAVAALADAGVRVGVSVDGGEVATDRHRRLRSGRTSYPALLRGLAALRERPEAYAGLLCVIDVANDPLATFADLLRHGPSAIDFLLPHGNWTTPPPGRPGDDSTPYADWLIPIFDAWYDAPTVPVSVRFFEEVIHGLLGGASRSESIGLSPVAVVVIDVSGALEQVDTLRTAYPGAVSTELTVYANTFDEALDHPQIVARQSGIAGLSEECRRCPVVRTCGGGYYPHRYRAGAGFTNPSVFCRDLFRFISHVRARVAGDVARIGGRSTHADALPR